MSISIQDVDVGSVFQAADGTLFRVESFCTEPTVRMVAVGDKTHTKYGGVSGYTWKDFKPVTLPYGTTPDKPTPTGE